MTSPARVFRLTAAQEAAAEAEFMRKASPGVRALIKAPPPGAHEPTALDRVLGDEMLTLGMWPLDMAWHLGVHKLYARQWFKELEAAGVVMRRR